jgi:hypothetical protein
LDAVDKMSDRKQDIVFVDSYENLNFDSGEDCAVRHLIVVSIHHLILFPRVAQDRRNDRNLS